jgi:Protein of unknown function (DUF3302)
MASDYGSPAQPAGHVVASTVAVIVFLAALPGRIAHSRKHPWSQAATVAGWITLFLGFALWPVALIWAYVDVPTRRTAEPRP